MSDPFVGEIKMFGGNFAPRGYATCDGQLLSISQNNALFALLGTIYGGDGRTTFALPDLRGRLPIDDGTGPGLSPRNIGARAGAENVSITAASMPPHSHTIMGTTDSGDSNNPADKVPAVAPVAAYSNQPPDPANARFDSIAISNTGGGAAHANLMPSQVINFIIALTGLFPSRN
jgi:microcystin-dependent protein